MGKLATCRTCKNEIASSANTCPKCGASNKRSKAKLVVGVVGGLALLGAILPSKKEESATAAPAPSSGASVAVKKAGPFTQEQLVEKLKAQVEGGNLFNVGRVEFTEFQDQDISMRFRYESGKAMSANEAEVIAVGLVTLTVKELVAAGYNPRENTMHVSAMPIQSVDQKTITGQSQYRMYGIALYSPYKDEVSYKLDKR